MKKHIFRITTLTLAAMLVLVSSCVDLDTENLNNPDTNQTLSTGADLNGLLAGAYLQWWQANHREESGMTLQVAGDAVSCSWGNFAMQRMSWEPRREYVNSATESDDYKDAVRFPWNRNNAAVSSANNVIRAFEVDGLEFTVGGVDQVPMILASAYLLRGLARGYIGLTFDQGYIVELDTDVSQPLEFRPYNDIIDAALADLDEAISRSRAGNFTMDASYLNGLALSSDQMVELASSYAARLLVQSARSESETNSVDWNRVLQYTNEGLSFDFAPIADNNTWFSYQQYATTGNGGANGSWARVDQRIISMVDPSQPNRYPLDGSFGKPNNVIQTPDARFPVDENDQSTDFVYVETNNFSVARGLWHFGHYKHFRESTDPNFGTGLSGPMVAFAKTDNDLLKAEAHYRLGNLGEAVNIINAGTRVSRGNLPPATADNVWEAIWYERLVEILNTGPGGTYFDRRRVKDEPAPAYPAAFTEQGLQAGTPKHYGIPAEELEIFQLETYTFGGADEDPTGLNRH